MNKGANLFTNRLLDLLLLIVKLSIIINKDNQGEARVMLMQKRGIKMNILIMKSAMESRTIRLKKAPKSDLDELFSLCNSFAHETNLTHEEIQNTIYDVRKRLNECGC